MPEFVVPDSIEPVTAYRAFTVLHPTTPLLRSTSQRHVFSMDEIHLASCNRTHLPGTTAPVSGCHCGFYALRSLPEVFESFEDYVHAEVKLFGRVISGEISGYIDGGYKAEKLVLSKLFYDEHRADLIKRIAEDYKVPAEPYPEDLLARRDFLKKISSLEHSLACQMQDAKRRVEEINRLASLKVFVEAKGQIGKVYKSPYATGRSGMWDSAQSRWIASDRLPHYLDSRLHAGAYILQGQNKRDRPVANNTRLLFNSQNDPAVRFHETNICTMRDDGLMLDTAGWTTVTTKARMNDVLESMTDYRVYSESGVWKLMHKDGWSRTGFHLEYPRREDFVEETLFGQNHDAKAYRRARYDYNRAYREWERQFILDYHDGMVVPYKTKED